MNIGTVIDKTVEIEFEYKGELVKMEIVEEAMTPGFSQSLQDVDKNPIELASAFASVTKDWNIDYNGEPFPPNLENFKRLPMSFYEKAMEALGESFAGKQQTSSESVNGSAPPAKLKVA